jgi:membrane protease YdiL (CAAX protease family)
MEPFASPTPPEFTSPPEAPSISRPRWWIFLLLLTAYPLSVGLISAGSADGNSEPILPRTARGVFLLGGVELVIFGVVFAMAWLASRASAEELCLKWRDGLWPLLRGFGYSIALRIFIGIVAAAAILVARALFGAGEAELKRAMPRVEAMVDAKALTQDPLYFCLMLTFVSFVVAGLREELWRAGMLAGLQALFPKHFRNKAGGLVAVTIIAVAFGLGHLPQGWSGVAVTTLLGIGLGGIIVLHRSIWDAVLAHGFFDATTFVMLYLIARFFPDVSPAG